jgi:predicted RNA-binding Zn-ribbon protein involved in translation (DUF1610 family)
MFIEEHETGYSERSDVFCPVCDRLMVFNRKGKYANQYVCEGCGVTIDPKIKYTVK